MSSTSNDQTLFNQTNPYAMTPTLIFGAFNFAKMATEYLGIVEGVDKNVKKLVHAPYKSAVSNLQAALNAKNDENRKFYIRQALIEFNQSTSLEENENLILAYLGKGMCQSALDDHINAAVSFNAIKGVQLSLSEKSKAVSKAVVGTWCKLYLPTLAFITFMGGMKSYWGPMELKVRKLKFQEFKNKILASIDQPADSATDTPLIPEK